MGQDIAFVHCRLVPLGTEYGLLGGISVPVWSGCDGHGSCKSRP